MDLRTSAAQRHFEVAEHAAAVTEAVTDMEEGTPAA
jgi:hypothetical protein